MAASHRARCLNCGKHRSEVGEITWAGYCSPCGKEIYLENMDNLHDRSGPYYLHWLRRSFMASRKQLLAAEQSTEGI